MLRICRKESNGKIPDCKYHKRRRITLIRSWIPDDEVIEGCDIDLWDMYADYINGKKEISECNAAFTPDYIGEDDLPVT